MIIIKIVISYDIDLPAYQTAEKHIILRTELLTSGNSTLVHQQMNHNDAIRLSNRLSREFAADYQHETDSYFQHGRYDEPTLITRSTYLEMHAEFMKETHESELEEVVVLTSLAPDGKHEHIAVQVTVKGGVASAVVEFDSFAQYERVTIPAWMRRREG